MWKARLTAQQALPKLLNARQLGLKFIANVTYGYTSATFSGRMPCVEIADAIVQTGRETLERVSHGVDTSAWLTPLYRQSTPYKVDRIGARSSGMAIRTRFSYICLARRKTRLS